MKFCTKCGASLEDKALFCTKCGASLKDEAKEAPAVEAEPTIVLKEPIKTAKDEPKAAPAPKVEVKSVPVAVSKTEPKQPSGVFVKLLCILLSFVFCTVLFLTSVVGIVRNTVDPDMIARNIASVEIEDIGEIKIQNDKGKVVPIAEYILDFCNDEVIEKYDLDKDKIIQVIKDTKADEFLGEIVGDYVAFLVGAEELKALDGERVVSWLRENEEAIEAVVQYEFKEADYNELESQIDKSDVIKSISEREIMDELDTVDLAVVKHGLSLYIYITMIVLVCAIGGLMIAINKKKVRAAFTYVTVCLAIVGGIFLLVAGSAFAAISFVLPEVVSAHEILSVLLEPFVMPILIRGAVMFGFGLIASIVYKIVSDRRRVKAHK